MRILGILAALTWCLFSSHCQAAITGLQQIASGFSGPAFATHAPGDPNRLFVAELGGSIKIVDLNSNTTTGTFLHISDTDAAGEGGLLGLAFHPNYFAPVGTTGRGKFYVYVTVDNGGDTSLGIVSPFSSRIREYSVLGDPATSNVADTSPTSKREILSFVQPQANHNGGWIGFSPNDGYLYIMSGDGGGSGDNEAGHTLTIGNAQDVTSNFLGKVLRIDVNGDDFPGETGIPATKNYRIPSTNPFKAGVGVPTDDGGDDEIWGFGLRNPFRASFDRVTSDLWIGDVGQGAREEIDHQPASSTGGENYGWRLFEGNEEYGAPEGAPFPASYAHPVFDYPRSGTVSGKTVIGGYVYRGPDPSLQGQYFFADSGDFGNSASNKFWTFDSTDLPENPNDPEPVIINIKPLLTPDVGSPRFPVSYGEDAVGNLYIVYLETNEVYRIVTNELLAGDYNADGEVDQFDYTKWRQTLRATGAGLAADGNGNGVVDAADYAVWRKNLGASVRDGAGAGGESSVPEPGTIAYLVAAFSALSGRRRMV